MLFRSAGALQISGRVGPTIEDAKEETSSQESNSVDEASTQVNTQSPIQIVPDLNADGKVSPVEQLVFWSVVSIVTAVVTYLSM